ncbi:phage baseplate assembly protein [Candidatus Sodalis endolongispinus]|uniref:Phage baseplate assembly protein n=1 Tax=Candidatus Sodalis endolongispinus TaxID=2812662 RepID=A0ABS5YB55_9GAMM|nr:phage baseplate assembly protein V [Candidatus Sodalis endolongispinus]MBT9431351.1 phage baseplate assembly protein [Candidatus Sodalis endolongispinus]
MADLIAHIDQRIRRALSGLRLAYRAVLRRVTPTGGVQTAQVSGLAGESTPDVELFQHYGLTSVPPAGTMAVVLPVGGCTRHSIVIATEHSTYRMQGLANGEVALYSDEGAKIVIRREKIIEVECDEYRVKCKRYQVEAEERAGFEKPMLSTSQALTAEGPISGHGGMTIEGGDGAVARFAGDIEHQGGTLRSAEVEINGIRQSGHRHPTPSGLSDGPVNG